MAKPPRHGQIKTSTWKLQHAKQHLAMVTESTNTVKDYGSHGDIGQSSQGAMSNGASGASYSTNNQGTVGDADSGGT